MPLPKKKSQNLGNSLMKDRFKGARPSKAGERSLVHTSELNDGVSWASENRSVSITQQDDLTEFLATAEMAGTDFTAERQNAQIVTQFENEALPSITKRQAQRNAEEENKDALRIPRRPAWTREMTAEELQQLERESFLDWRRRLAQLQENEDILLTPFERNIDFWRQLWRVIERSDVVVQIVDARNPLLFRCQDLEEYVHEIDPNKTNLLLINKADMLTEEQRHQWVDYFMAEKIPFVFFSAHLEAAKIEEEEQLGAAQAEDNEEKDEEIEKHLRDWAGLSLDGDVESDDDEDEDDAESDSEQVEGQDATPEDEDNDGGDNTPRPAESPEPEASADAAQDADPTAEEEKERVVLDDKSVWELIEEGAYKLYDVEELMQLVSRLSKTGKPRATIGLVGYPNVGKSSTINAICQTKKVSVSATPGKTKHFQTILFDDVELCDCPGLVFPNFASTKAELVCNGVLPIDQLRDVIPPATHVCQTVPRTVLETIYGIHIISPAEEEDPNRPPTALEFLNAYSFARGMMNASGLPDIQRGARIVLKDFVKGKLLFCHSPPGYDQLENKIIDPKKFDSSAANTSGPRHRPTYVNDVDDEFFRQKNVKVVMGAMAGSEARRWAGGPKAQGGKKHNKKNKREKTRRVMKAK